MDPELFDLPETLRAFLERAGYHVRAAVVGRVDGRPLVDLDRRRLPALLRLALDTSTEGGPAGEALVPTPDGGLEWSPEARAALDARGVTRPKKAAPPPPTKAPKKAPKRATRAK